MKLSIHMRKPLLIALLISFGLSSCKKDPKPTEQIEDATSFSEIGSLDIGGEGAAEISAFDPVTNKLFVVNNQIEDGLPELKQIDVIDFKDPSNMKVVHSITISSYGAAVNSLSVHDGKLAAAIEATDKQANGKVVIFKTSDYSKVAEITVGALPDMVTYTPDGKYIITANEGEPDADYINDPAGTVSIISVNDNYAVTTFDFSSMLGQWTALTQKGFRVFGKGNDFVKDIEPEYITVSADSKTAWITLQENNAIAKIDIVSKTISNIFPLGFKDYNQAGNEIDPSNVSVGYSAAKWPVRGMYLPDAIAVIETNGIPYLFTANEGDARDYDGFSEEARIKDKDILLDATKFPNAAELKKDDQLGRLNITTTLGDIDGDGDYDELYSFGSRSFSVWNGLTGTQVFDSKNELDVKCVAAGIYDDGRSDDKSVEPEGVTIGKVGNKNIAFVGLERADAVAIYDVTIPTAPQFLQLLKCGDAPEGLLFVAAKDSPTKRSLLVVSSEGDGVVKIFSPKSI